MERSEIKLKILELNQKADMTESLLNGLSEEIKKERGIVIVGQGDVGRNDIALRAEELSNQNIVVIGDNNQIDVNTFEIDGIKYREKEKEQNRFPKTMSRLILMASAFGARRKVQNCQRQHTKK